MMVPYYQINAFSEDPFKGNPAGVCVLSDWLPVELMQTIALENALAETAFIVPIGSDFHIRWFTPEIEMDLCGHATLAAAYVLQEYFDYPNDSITFHSQSGVLYVRREDRGLVMDFPARPATPAVLPNVIGKGFNHQPLEVLKARDYLLIYPNEKTIRDIKADRSILDGINIDPGAIVVTAAGEHVDFVSRVFTPQASVFEDPVTGSTHCSLIPLWSERLNKTILSARQISSRTGHLFCEDRGDRVFIGGACYPFLKGELSINV